MQPFHLEVSFFCFVFNPKYKYSVPKLECGPSVQIENSTQVILMLTLISQDCLGYAAGRTEFWISCGLTSISLFVSHVTWPRWVVMEEGLCSTVIQDSKSQGLHWNIPVTLANKESDAQNWSYDPACLQESWELHSSVCRRRRENPVLLNSSSVYTWTLLRMSSFNFLIKRDTTSLLLCCPIR